MYLYIIFVLFALLAGLNVFNLVSCVRLRYIYCMCIIVLIAFSCLRWERGTDWEAYYLFYREFNSITIDGYMEPGFNLLTSFNKIFAPWYTFHLFIMALVAIGCIAVTIQKYSVYPFVSLLVWFTMTLSNLFPVRQTIAIAVLVYASKFIINKNKYKFIIFLCIAISFHYSAVIFGLAYYLFYRRYSQKTLILTLLIGVIFAIIAESLVSNIIYTLGGDFFQEKLAYYMEANAENSFGSAYSAKEILFRGIVNRSLLFVIPLVFLEKKRQSDVIFNGFFNLYYFAFLVFVLMVPLSPVLGRLASYYDYSQFFIIPYFFKIPFTRKSLYVIYFIVLTYCTMRFNGVVQNYKDEYIPYKSVFSI